MRAMPIGHAWMRFGFGGILAAVGLVALHSLALAAGEEAAEDCEQAPEVVAVSDVPSGLVSDLIGWIALNTDYDVSLVYHEPPLITFCEVGDLVPYEDVDLLVEPALRAAYDLRVRRIHLVEPWSPDEPFDVSVLLHELIHDVQLANREWECVNAPEFEAYWLQDRWLSERGVRVEFNWVAIARHSLCPE